MNLRRESELELEVEDVEDDDEVEALDMVRVLGAEELAVLVSIARWLRSIIDDERRVSDEQLGLSGRWNTIMVYGRTPGQGEWGLGLK